MTYHSVGEILRVKHATYGEICDRLSGVTPNQAGFHPPQGGWSIAEVLEHVNIVEHQMLAVIVKLTVKTEGEQNAAAGTTMRPVSLQAIIDRSKTEKYRASEAALPTGTIGIDVSLNNLRDVEEQLDGLRPRLESIDLTHAVFPNRLFGPLTLGEWLAFVEIHERRHLGQIESIMASPGFADLGGQGRIAG